MDMKHREPLDKVIEILSDMTEHDDISENDELIEDLDISSMDVLFIISSLEEEFEIQIPEKEVRKMVTVGDVVNTIKMLKKM